MVRTRSQRAEREEKGPEDHRTRSRPTTTQKAIAPTTRKSKSTNAQPSSSATQSTAAMRRKPQSTNAVASSSATQSSPTSEQKAQSTNAQASPSTAHPTPITNPVWKSRVVRADSTINKTAALAKYKLKVEDLKGIPYTSSNKVVDGLVRPMYLYNERAIEKKAWEVHGGPDGLKEKLDTLRKRKRKGEFQAPDWYLGQGPRVTIGRLPPPPGGYTPFDISTYEPYLDDSTILQNIKRDMMPWLWRECVTTLNNINFSRHFDERNLSQREREEAMQKAFQTLTYYPPRPAEPFPSSPAVDALRAVLADAPKYPPMEQWEEEFDDLDMSHSSSPDYMPKYEWSEDYVGRLFHALHEVVEAHGMGDAGWRTARWEVYEKYKEKMTDGFRYYLRHPTRWYDDAAKWLREDTLRDGFEEHCRVESEDSDVVGES